MTHNNAAFTVVLALALLSLSAAAVAPTLTFTFKDVVIKGATEVDSYAINNAGVIAGDYIDSAGVQHAFLLKGTKLTTVDNKNCAVETGETALQFYGINSAGTAAGWCTNTSGVEIGFTYANKKFTNISIKGATEVNVNGINDKGDIVGAYFDTAGAQHGFLLEGKTLTTLDPPGEVSLATAWSVNDSGVVAVYAANSNGDYISFTTANKGKTYKPFTYSGAGSVGTVIHHINNKGDIDGTYFDSNSYAHGVLFHGGNYYSFDDPKADNSTRADGLNDTLGIVGRYTPSSGGNVGYFAQAK